MVKCNEILLFLAIFNLVFVRKLSTDAEQHVERIRGEEVKREQQ